MKIGIGVTTYNRPEHLKLWRRSIEEFTTNYLYYVADDSKDRKGIAYRKNECLRALQDCDYIFLFDDDCFPIKEGWAEFFIEASKASGQQHMMYLKETGMIKKIAKEVMVNCPITEKQSDGFPGINIYNNCSGCLMFFTKECIQKVGGYCKDYGIYGFEHAGYSDRIHRAGLTPLDKYTCPSGIGEYIYAMDYDFHLPFNKQVNHKPSIEINKLKEYVAFNQAVYQKDITQIYQPL